MQTRLKSFSLNCQTVCTFLLYFFKIEGWIDEISWWKEPWLCFKIAIFFIFQNYFNPFPKLIQQLGLKLFIITPSVKFEIRIQINHFLTQKTWYLLAPTHCRSTLPCEASTIDYRSLSVPFYKVIHSFILALQVFLLLSFKMVSCLSIIIFTSSLFSLVLSQIEALKILILCRHCNWNHT